MQRALLPKANDNVVEERRTTSKLYVVSDGGGTRRALEVSNLGPRPPPETLMFYVQDDTSPRLATVRRNLEADKYEATKTSYPLDDLAQQLFALEPVLQSANDAFVAMGFTDIEKKRVEAHRFLEIAGYAAADARALTSTHKGHGEVQRQLREQLMTDRSAVVRLAKDAGVDAELFSVRFGRGDSSNVITPARVFLALLEKHGDKLGAPKLLDVIVADTEAAIDALLQAELAEEVAKAEKALPTALRQRARDALYAHLLHFSRVGYAVTRRDVALRVQFRLTVLQAKKASPSMDDDHLALTVVDTPLLNAVVNG